MIRILTDNVEELKEALEMMATRIVEAENNDVEYFHVPDTEKASVLMDYLEVTIES